ncbi:NAC domain-containing protein 30-like [Lycium barbarum]|uniref:NAC domain-containing protein 30-like n=1 Tax=Lycium barbarum TaxID=112863 RepID=UPI00293F67E8|nr:NAC domain-containing protein 30-like [Lycium barbarum]
MENQEIPQLLPGFTFNPKEEQLVGFYLKNKVNSEYHGDVIPDIDLRMEPWDIKAKVPGYEEQDEWYYFGRNNRKYATGTKIDRTTQAGYWKVSGSDKAVFSKNGEIIGTKRSLVFYKGRAPKGTRTNWTTYEYRLLTSQHGPPDQTQEYQEWVVCKGFIKQSPNNKSCLESMNNDLCIKAITSNPSSTMHHNDPSNPIFNQTSNFNQFTFNPSHHQDGLISSQIGDELPQPRDIPNTISTMLGTKEDQGLYVQNSIANKMSANNEEEKSSQFMLEPATSSYSFPNFPLAITSTSDDDMKSQLLEDYPTMYI